MPQKETVQVCTHLWGFWICYPSCTRGNPHRWRLSGRGSLCPGSQRASSWSRWLNKGTQQKVHPPSLSEPTQIMSTVKQVSSRVEQNEEKQVSLQWLKFWPSIRSRRLRDLHVLVNKINHVDILSSVRLVQSLKLSECVKNLCVCVCFISRF